MQHTTDLNDLYKTLTHLQREQKEVQEDLLQEVDQVKKRQY